MVYVCTHCNVVADLHGNRARACWSTSPKVFLGSRKNLPPSYPQKRCTLSAIRDTFMKRIKRMLGWIFILDSGILQIVSWLLFCNIQLLDHYSQILEDDELDWRLEGHNKILVFITIRRCIMTIMKWVFMFQSDKECCKNLREFGSFLRVYRVLQFFIFLFFFSVTASGKSIYCEITTSCCSSEAGLVGAFNICNCASSRCCGADMLY